MLQFYRYSPLRPGDEFIDHKSLIDEPIVFEVDDINTTFKIGFQGDDESGEYTLEVDETSFNDFE